MSQCLGAGGAEGGWWGFHPRLLHKPGRSWAQEGCAEATDTQKTLTGESRESWQELGAGEGDREKKKKATKLQ